MENNPFYRGGEGEKSNQDELLVRNIWLPQFTEARELAQSTIKLLRPTPEEGRDRNFRLGVADNMQKVTMSALLLPGEPLYVDSISRMSRLIEQKHRDITIARQNAITSSSIHSNAEKLAEAFEPMSEISTDYFDDHLTSPLREPVMDGLAAHFATSQAMTGLEQYLRDNLTGESNAKNILTRIGLEATALSQVQNRSPLRFILRDIGKYQEEIIELNKAIGELGENENYKIIVQSDKELQQVLLQLKSYIKQ